ncbi:transposase family protein [Streptomyces olivaceoviridis]|uniref:transposase family protein n=1 Tax=Streptomyces olivaceoviridis TaxID=1921 RepID=UPI00332F0964
MSIDWLLATLVHLRHWVAHDALACWGGADRSTITRAIGELRLLLAERACTSVPVGACGPSSTPATRASACRLTGT